MDLSPAQLDRPAPQALRPAALIERYRDEAVRLRVHVRPGSGGTALQVAATLLTCATAAAILNALGLPAEPGSAYRYLNVHNPRCPLFHADDGLGWRCRPGLEDHPVWGLNWAGAVLVCSHLGARLPLAAEWECFASNNDPARTYPWGDEPPDPARANYGEHLGGPCSVGRFPPSELGLYDLAGNLDEWCQDTGDTPGRAGAFERLVKGGAWSKDACHLKVAARRSKWARLGTTTIGVRPVWPQ